MNALLLKNLYNKISTLGVSHVCPLCRQHTPERLCNGCQQFLYHTIATSYKCCHCCGLPLISYKSQNHTIALQHICGGCMAQPPSFDHTISAYIYQAPLKHLLARFKYQQQLAMGKLLSDLFCRVIAEHYQQGVLPDMITAVPLHWIKQWRRGFNQSVFFSEQLSQTLHIPIFKPLKRIKATAEQKQLTRKQRLTNLNNSFVVNSAELQGKHIAIIDDVMTTGATVDSVAKVLKRAGAKQVSVWVLARTPQW